MRVFPKYIFAESYLNIKVAFIIIVGTLIIGLIGFKIIEDLSWIDALYMTIITFSTVGFGTIHALSQGGKLFTSGIIILNIGTLAYALSVFSYYFIEGQYFARLKNKLITKKIQQMDNHIIVCGMGRYGEEIVSHFLHHNMKFVIIERDGQRITELEHHFGQLNYIEEDATSDDVLVNAGIEKASALISALPDDSDNVFTVLSARQLNPKINIISRAFDNKSVKKLKLAGADHVIMPEHIGGFYMATLVSKPDAVEFFAFIANEQDSNISFEEITFESLPKKYQGSNIKDTKIRLNTGANIIGFKNPDGSFIANPDPNTRFVENSSFIVIGNKDQLLKLKNYLDV